MDQPVRVELMFPRSGQQLFVSVPRQYADFLDAGRTDHKPQFSNRHTQVSESTSCTREHGSRPQ